jgi:hypothetical protein
MQTPSYRQLFRLQAFGFAVLTSVSSFQSMAQDLEPRSYTNIPIDMHFLVAGYGRSQGGLSPAPEVPIEQSQIEINAGIIGYATTFDLGGSSSKFDVVASRVCMAGSAVFQGEYVEAERCGYADPVLKLTWNFYGAPALTRQEFGQYQEGLVMGVSLQVTAPIGEYDPSKLVNIGANQWVFRPGFGVSFRQGNWYYGANTTVRLYSDNDEFYNGVNLDKAPQYSLQGHVIYSLAKGQWLSLSGNYFMGGETSKNGIQANDDQDNSRFGLTYSIALNQQHSLKFYANTGVITRIGNDFDSFGVLWQYAL